MSQENMNQQVKIYDLIIIGAGWTGLVACKHALENNLKVLVLESRDDIGGLWKYSSDLKTKSVTKNTRTNFSKTFYELSDYPFPLDYPDYPTNDQIYKYLQNYAIKYNLLPHIKLKSWVKNVEKETSSDINYWKIKDSNHNIYVANYVSICIGQQGKYQIPKKTKTNLKQYSGKIIDAASFKYSTPDYLDKNILIIGKNELATCIADEIKFYSKKIYWLIEDGQWFLPKFLNSDKSMSKPLDCYYSVLNYSFYVDKKKKGVFLLEDLLEKEYGKSGHGIKEWVSNKPLKHSDSNMNVKMLDQVYNGKYIPKKNIKIIKNNYVVFSDDTFDKIDAIILAYNSSNDFRFLPEKYQLPMHKNYKYIFNSLDPTISFLGYVTPNIGSEASISELQAMFMAKVYSGKYILPDAKKRYLVAERDSKYWKKFFKNMKEYYVDLELYSQDIGKKINVYPNYTRLFFKSPNKWWQAVTAPFNNCRYLLNDENNHSQIFIRYSKYSNKKLNPINYIFLLFKPFYLGIRRLFNSQESNSLDYLEDKEHRIKFNKNKKLVIFVILSLIIIIIVPEWRKIFINNIIKFLGPLDNYESKLFKITLIVIILFLLYSNKY